MRLGIVAAVGAAFRFQAANAISIFRIGWLPVTLALSVGNLSAAIDAARPSTLIVEGREGALLLLMPVAVLWLSVATHVLANVTVVAAYLRLMLERDERKNVLFYFWFGEVELRYLAAYVLLLGAFALVVMGTAALSVAFARPHEDSAFIPLELVPAVLIAALLWVWLKLALQPAVILRESGLGFMRAWRLSRRNLMRIAAVLALTVGLVSVLTFGAYFAVLGSDWPTFPDWR